nr:hypothetical protein [Tanacetum cinerariifolium]
MSSSDSAVTYMSISSEDVPLWGVRFFGMEQPDSSEAALQSPIQTPPVPHNEDEQDEHVLLAEEQPLPPVVSPTAESPEYVTESDPEEYEDDELEDGPVDYPMDEGDDRDDDDGDSSGDDTDNEDEEDETEEHLALTDFAIVVPAIELIAPSEGTKPDDELEDGPVDYPMDEGDDRDDDDGDSSGDDTDNEDEEDETEEHLALTDFAIVVPAIELIAPSEGTKPVIPPPSIDIATTGAKITVRLQASISLPLEVEVKRLLAMPTPPSSPLTSLSPSSTRERLARCTAPSAHSSPPPMPSPLLPSSGCPTQIQTLRMASTQALIDAVTAALLSPPLPPPLCIPPPVDRKDDTPETKMPPRKRSCLFAQGSRPTGGRGIDYEFVSTLDAEARRQGISEVG